MAHETQPISINPVNGDETHPSFAVVQITRSQNSYGAALFQTDMPHHETIEVTISTATRNRQLNRDWVHVDQQVARLSLSFAQWASLVASDSGRPVPATLTWVQGQGSVPQVPAHESRLSVSTDEVEAAVDKVLAKIEEAHAKLEEKNSAENRRNLKFAIENAKRNALFATESLHEHVEKVKENTRLELEAEATLAYERAGAHALAQAKLYGEVEKAAGAALLSTETDVQGEIEG